jgi:indole-3-glycerol phosphate synthase
MLDKIVEKTRAEVQLRKSRIPADLFELEGKTRSLKGAISSKERAVITEIKPASPTQGRIKQLSLEQVADVARDMEAGGACALSVLTEPFFFFGSLDNLKAAKKATQIPVMRKDFIVDEYQLLEAKHYGADAVLLMVSVLGESAENFYKRTSELGMEAIVEVHDESEIPFIPDKAEIIGINNRNLKDLRVELGTTKELSAKIPKGKLIVSESGVKIREDLDFVLKYADAALVGTSLMRADDIEKAVRGLTK